MPTLPCFICGKEVDIRLSKRNKPYMVCDCGVQIFIRYGEAEKLLLEKISEHENKKSEEVHA